MARTGENIYKRKDGRWEGRFIRERINGKIRYGTVYARSYREAKEKLHAAKKQFEKEKNFTKAGSVADISKKWLAEAAGILKKSSINKYEDLLRCYILPRFGDKELSMITNEELMDFVNALLKGGGTNRQGLSASTVSEVLSAMNGMRTYALKRNYSVRFSTECVSVRQEKKKNRTFSRSEEQQLIEYLYSNMDYTAVGILVCLFTGIRVGELCALNWDDINLAEKTMRVCKTMQRLRENTRNSDRTQVQILAPKSPCSNRTIPIPDEIMGVLTQYYVPGAFLLTGHAKQFVEPRTMQNRFKKILSACGIEGANFHATRHTFATRCVELGFDVKSLSEILGHASVSITMNRYVHPSMELKAENMNRFSELFAVKTNGQDIRESQETGGNKRGVS